jgi:glycosyltransferase involved in cell wall biosynthesis
MAFEEGDGLCIDLNSEYYRFADLSMKLREKGYQTVYYPKAVLWDTRDPKSVEDITEKEGAITCRNKWKNVLDKEHADSREQEFWARDRSNGKKTILFIDDRVPNFDKSAGDRTSYQYLEVLAHMGYNIKDIGNDFIHSEPYSGNLENLGIEIIGADGTGDRAWQEMLDKNGKFFNFVYLTRPHIAQKFMSSLKKYTNAKIIYYCCDLHFLRLQREYELKNDQIGLSTIPEIEKEEIEICENADVVFTLSTYEQEILERKLKNPKVRLNPIFIYSEFPTINLDFTKREDLIFVGGFAHTPNVDAVKWFCEEILPAIIQRKPGIKIHIVGSNPSNEVIALECNNVVVHGFMKDEDLMKLYNQCRLSVIPLRYGAGVKGKVLEAMYYGLPIVSTSIGIEGIEDIDQYIAATDTAGGFSCRILEIYDRVEELTEISRKNQEYIKEHYAQEKVEIFFNSIFTEI